MSLPISKGDQFVWPAEDSPDAVQVTVIRVARDGTWADIEATANGVMTWSKRQRLPFPASFRRIVGGAA
jgi:hypothetical protein